MVPVLKVVILGYGQMLANLVAGCLEANCEVVGVFRYDKVRYPFIDRVLLDTFNPTVEYSYIKSRNLYEINARSANSAEFKKEVLKLNADVVLVGTWGEKFKKHIIDIPKIATINVHPSLLPKYRGPNPYLQAIKNLETKSGVTFHLMDEEYDTGPILLQKSVDIEPTDTGKELRDKIALCSKNAVVELINTLNDDVIIPVNQDENKASYYPQISEDDVMLDFSKPASEVHAHIRAFYPWYKCYFGYKKEFFTPNPYKLEVLDNNTKVTEAGTIVEKSSRDKSITVLCGDNKLLKMRGVRLFGFFNRFLTRFYIKNSVKENQKII